jgi:cytochrome P450 family 117 subfamily A
MFDILAKKSIQYRDGIPVLPRRLPLLGHAWIHSGDVGATLREGKNQLGPLFWIDIFLNKWCLIYLGDDALEVIRSKEVTNAHMREFKMAMIILGESLLTQEGAEHRHMRSAMNAPFTPRGLGEARVGEQIASTVTARVDEWIERKQVSAITETKKLALEVIFRVVGVESSQIPSWREKYERLTTGSHYPPIMLPGFPGYNALKARQWLDRQVLAIVTEARHAASQVSLLSRLIRESDEDGAALSDAELVDNVRLLLLAGHETTSSVIAWIMIELARSADLWNELSTEFQKKKAIPMTLPEAAEFPFAEALFRESARFYAPQPLMTRKTTGWLTLRDYRVPPGTHVGTSPACLLRSPTLYPEPDRFQPSRWLGASAPPSAIDLCAFGAGRHFCLGYHLAWLETIQFTVALVSALSKRGLRPRLAGNQQPRLVSVASGVTGPSADTLVEFVA